MTLFDGIRVMISSTIEDLRDEREAVDRAITLVGPDRFRSETLGALPWSPYEVCERMAIECDVFILVIGRRYGTIIPSLDLSVTELEFQAARRSDKGKILVYVQELPEDIREPRASTFTRIATDFRSGYFRAQRFRTAQELEHQVRHDLASWLSSRVRGTHFSERALHALPTVDDSKQEILTVSLAIVVVILALLISRALGLSVFYGASLQDLLRAVTPDLAAATALTTGRALFATLLGEVCCVLAFTTVVSVTRNTAHLQRLVTITRALLWIALLFIASQGAMFFGFGHGVSIGTAALAVAATLASGTDRELAAWARANELAPQRRTFITLWQTLAVSPSVLNGLTAAFVAMFLYDMIFGIRGASLGMLSREALMLMRPEVSVMATLSLVVTVYTLRIVARTIQSHVAIPMVLSAIKRSAQSDADSR